MKGARNQQPRESTAKKRTDAWQARRAKEILAERKTAQLCERSVFFLQTRLSESAVASDALMAAVQKLFKPSHVEDVAVNRSQFGICGFPQCSAPPNPEGHSTRGWKLDFTSRNIYDAELLSQFCSQDCLHRFEKLLSSLSSQPSHLRGVKPPDPPPSAAVPYLLRTRPVDATADIIASASLDADDLGMWAREEKRSLQKTGNSLPAGKGLTAGGANNTLKASSTTLTAVTANPNTTVEARDHCERKMADGACASDGQQQAVERTGTHQVENAKTFQRTDHSEVAAPCHGDVRQSAGGERKAAADVQPIEIHEKWVESEPPASSPSRREVSGATAEGVHCEVVAQGSDRLKTCDEGNQVCSAAAIGAEKCLSNDEKLSGASAIPGGFEEHATIRGVEKEATEAKRTKEVAVEDDDECDEPVDGGTTGMAGFLMQHKDSEVGITKYLHSMTPFALLLSTLGTWVTTETCRVIQRIQNGRSKFRCTSGDSSTEDGAAPGEEVVESSTGVFLKHVTQTATDTRLRRRLMARNRILAALPDELAAIRGVLIQVVDTLTFQQAVPSLTENHWRQIAAALVLGLTCRDPSPNRRNLTEETEENNNCLVVDELMLQVVAVSARVQTRHITKYLRREFSGDSQVIRKNGQFSAAHMQMLHGLFKVT